LEEVVMETLTARELQRQTLRFYGELAARRENWGGKLVFSCGAGAVSNGLAAAVSIAGGTTLVLDPDAARVKAAFRQGGVDFVVNSLDEGLRVLKNEIRKHRPLSVAVLAGIQPVVGEMVERGVLPDLLVEREGEAGTGEFAGVERPRFGVAESERLKDWMGARGWSEVVLSAESTSGLREMDVRVLGLLPEEDVLRRAWVQRIGHYQRGAGGGVRVVWLTEAERAVVG
jgi:urocanate hydratase